jgi:hypothetical protein
MLWQASLPKEVSDSSSEVLGEWIADPLQK